MERQLMGGVAGDPGFGAVASGGDVSFTHYAAYTASMNSSNANLSGYCNSTGSGVVAVGSGGTAALLAAAMPPGFAGLANASSLAEAALGLQSVVLAALARQYLHNDFFAGGLCLMLVGLLGRALAALAEWAACRVRSWAWGSVEVAVPPDSEAFVWVREWVAGLACVSSSDFSLLCKWAHETTPDHTVTPNDRPDLHLLPRLQHAQHIRFHGHKVSLQMCKLKSEGSASSGKAGGGGGGQSNSGVPGALQQGSGKEELVLRGPSKSVIESVVNTAMEAHFKKAAAARATWIWRWRCDEMYWMPSVSKSARPLDSVVLQQDPTALLEDARRFLASAEWYNSRGIPHRRGYLLYGPPGCGKTSLIRALAGALSMDVALISLSAKGLNDDTLHTAMNHAKFRSIFVLEDVDATFTKSRGDGSDKSNELSFSGLLNAVDGISTQEGRIMVMTTNHLERLDPALIRPGRIDMRFYLGLTSTSQACRMFEKWYPSVTEEQVEQVRSAMVDGMISPASLQGFFLENRENAEEVVARLPSFVAKEVNSCK